MNSKVNSKQSLDTALSRFLAQLEANGRSGHTIAQYRRHVRVLIRWLSAGDLYVDVQLITHEILATFLAAPEATKRPDGQRKKATSANALRTSIRCFFGYLRPLDDEARLAIEARVFEAIGSLEAWP